LPPGSVTRANAWKQLQADGRVKEGGQIPPQSHDLLSVLEAGFLSLKEKTWSKETAIYPEIVSTLSKTLYPEGSGIHAVDSHAPPTYLDVCVTDVPGESLLYFLRYFFEFKLPDKDGLLNSAENLGQILDYFYDLAEKQPHRPSFVAILSNLKTSYVLTAQFSPVSVSVTVQAAPTLAEAVIYADSVSRSQARITPPNLDSIFPTAYNVLAATCHHFVLSVQFPTSESGAPHVGPRPATREQTSAGANPGWKPLIHRSSKSRCFALKMVHGSTSLANEIKILRQIKEMDGISHLPELVWSPPGDKQFGIVPIGQPINVRNGLERAIARSIVNGLVDGLKHLHKRNIVHRDIRLSNLVLDPKETVIIDFEKSYSAASAMEVGYEGGYICWPKRLLETHVRRYLPEPKDDLFACILVVLEILFPTSFNEFRSNGISTDKPHTPETLQLLDLWKSLERSKVWRQFMDAAEGCDYEKMKEMADVFCHF
jgi:hypothetical protein